MRGLQPGDYPAFQAFCADASRRGGVGGALPSYQAFERFSAMIGHWTMRGFGRYAITREGRAIGHVGPSHVTEEAAPEITWSLWDAADTGKGYATEAARGVLAHLFDTGWPSIIALVHEENAASIAVARRLGGVEDPSIPLPPYLSKGRRFLLTAERLS